MPVPARSFRFELGSQEAICPNRARPRWLTERIAAMGNPHEDPIHKNENAGLSWPTKKALKAAVRSDLKIERQRFFLLDRGPNG